jgi:predicted pyridoxine 5'-phosphate oxidase superfamily flavin-nucleotide-binding protein
MEKHIEQFVTAADSKALATSGGNGLNVVPVSSIRVVDGKIWLINYFMEKTKDNIAQSDKVALVCWTKMMGYQIKGTVAYHAEGEDFEAARQWIKEILPDRIVKGLLILTPEETFDVSPTKDTQEKFAASRSQDRQG